MTDDQATPASKPRSWADIAAAAALVLTVSAAALYSFGIAWLQAYLNRLGLSLHLFPLDFYEQLYHGSIVALFPLCMFFLFLLLGLFLGDVFYRQVSWFGKNFSSLAPPTKLLLWSAMLIPAWFLIQQINTYFATMAADKRMQQIKDAPCGDANDRSNVGLVLEMEYGKPIPQPGVIIICSERFCGLHDGRNATVVSLEGVKRMKTELPAGCPAAPPEKAAP